MTASDPAAPTPVTPDVVPEMERPSVAPSGQPADARAKGQPKPADTSVPDKATADTPPTKPAKPAETKPAKAKKAGKTPDDGRTVLKPDICVIGAGSGGLVVAAAAAAFGVEVVLLEKHKMGGDCLNYGCVPSKALIAAAGKAEMMRKASVFGVHAGAIEVDFAAVMGHVRRTIAAIEPMDSVERFTGLGVRVIEGAGHFIDADTVEVGDTLIRARRFVVATGSRPAVPAIAGLDTVPYLTNETVFDLDTLPQHLAILGGGPIGMELAQAFRRLGSRVTVLEAKQALGPVDRELADTVISKVRGEGVDLREGVRVTGVHASAGGVALTVADPDGETVLQASHLLVAAGRMPNIDGIGLDAAGIAINNRGIVTDDRLKTTNKRVFAVGDVAGRGQFTHLAGYHAGLVVRAILFRLTAKTNAAIVPAVTYCDPEIASVGITEDEARAAHKEIRVLRWSFHENDRAQADGRTTGHIKVVTDKKGRVLGVGIVGAQAGELIALWGLVIAQKLTVRSLTGFVPAYPTLSEVSRRAAVAYYTPSVTNPLLRRAIRFLRKFG